MRGMCKVVCAMGFDPIGFMASFVSCDETSVHICGQTAVESTGSTHVSCVLGVVQAVYILESVLCFHHSGTCSVSSPAALVSQST